MRIIRKSIYYASSIFFKFLGLFHSSLKAVVIHGEIDHLERKKKFEEARILRHKAITTINKKYLAPIWRQEGYDLLYRVKDYQKSLKAFETALDTLKLSPACYGIANPLAIYYGASMASAALGDIQKTKDYFQKFTEIYESHLENPKLEKYLVETYQEGIDWLKQYVSQTPENK